LGYIQYLGDLLEGNIVILPVYKSPNIERWGRVDYFCYNPGTSIKAL
jgi:hypothetical protein